MLQVCSGIGRAYENMQLHHTKLNFRLFFSELTAIEHGVVVVRIFKHCWRYGFWLARAWSRFGPGTGFRSGPGCWRAGAVCAVVAAHQQCDHQDDKHEEDDNNKDRDHI